MPRLHQRVRGNKLRKVTQQVARKLRASCCLKQHVASNTQLVAGNKQLLRAT